jgi:hypothetical protein
MEILAGLVELDIPDLLPAPWYNRPSLGLVNNTAVRIGVLKSIEPTAAPPDIIVTPLRTDRLHSTASVIIDLKERAGAVYETLREVNEDSTEADQDFNIALAETLTIDQRTQHRITLILEPPRFRPGSAGPQRAKYEEKIERFKKRVEKIDGFRRFSSNFVVEDTTEF